MDACSSMLVIVLPGSYAQHRGLIILHPSYYSGCPRLARRPGLRLLACVLLFRRRVSSTKLTSGVSAQALTIFNRVMHVVTYRKMSIHLVSFEV